MTEADVLLSKIDVEDNNLNLDFIDKLKIKQRNDYYQTIIASQTPPLSLNSSCLKKINSKEVFEKVILNSGKHLSTLIPEFKITRDFIFNLLKNYAYFDLSEEESRFLLQKYFSDTLSDPCIEEEPLDLNDEGVGINESDAESEIEDYIEKENNPKIETPSDIESESEDEEENENNKNEEEEEDSGVDRDNESSYNQVILEDCNEDENDFYNKNHPLKLNNSPNNIQTKQNNIEYKKHQDDDKQSRFIQSTTNFSSIRSMPTENFCNKKNSVLKKNNMTTEKINETKEIKKNISLFLKNALEKRSGIDKRTTIIQFLYKNNFKGKFDSSFFDMKDENGDLIFDHSLIDEWYDAIEQIEDKQKATFECSQLIITASLYGIECLAKKLGIKELSNISSEITDPTNLPKNLESTKRSLSNLIDNNMPNFFGLDLLFFIGNVYIKNKVGLSPL